MRVCDTVYVYIKRNEYGDTKYCQVCMPYIMTVLDTHTYIYVCMHINKKKQTDNSCPPPIFLEEITKLADFCGVYLAINVLHFQR